MWDPRRYLDTDFGLDDDDSFEPLDTGEPDEIDHSQPHIVTVMGAIDPDDLGVCQPCEHVTGWPGGDAPAQGVLPADYLEQVANELEAFITVGGRSMVDVSTGDSGRDVNALRLLAQRVPVHLVCATGRHVLDRAGDGPLDPAEFESALMREIRDGIGMSGVRPGLIVLGTTRYGLVPASIGTAVARVAVESGLPILVCGMSASQSHELLDWAEHTGLAPNRVILGHLDRSLEVQDLARLARRGARLVVDRIGTDPLVPDRQLASQVLQMAEAGFAGSLLLSQGLAGSEQFVMNGSGPGWIHLLERFTLELMAAGAGADLVRVLLVENPARALTIDPTSA